MKIVINQKIIKRNTRIGQVTFLGALAVLGISFFISVKRPDQLIYSMSGLLIGFLLFQVGMYYSSRWGRSPRPDEILERSLKGMGREYTIYHYTTPASHLLVGPAGIWVILPYYQTGTITYEKNRWRAKGGGFAQWYMRVFGQESIGRPDLEAGTETDAATRYLTRLLPDGTQIPEVKPALVFVHPKAELKVDETPLPAMKAADLKNFLKERAKEKPIGSLQLDMVRKALPQAGKEEE